MSCFASLVGWVVMGFSPLGHPKWKHRIQTKGYPVSLSLPQWWAWSWPLLAFHAQQVIIDGCLRPAVFKILFHSSDSRWALERRVGRDWRRSKKRQRQKNQEEEKKGSEQGPDHRGRWVLSGVRGDWMSCFCHVWFGGVLPVSHEEFMSWARWPVYCLGILGRSPTDGVFWLFAQQAWHSPVALPGMLPAFREQQPFPFLLES